jgi:hypothetical protein
MGARSHPGGDHRRAGGADRLTAPAGRRSPRRRQGPSRGGIGSRAATLRGELNRGGGREQTDSSCPLLVVVGCPRLDRRDAMPSATARSCWPPPTTTSPSPVLRSRSTTSPDMPGWGSAASIGTSRVPNPCSTSSRTAASTPWSRSSSGRPEAEDAVAGLREAVLGVCEPHAADRSISQALAGPRFTAIRERLMPSTRRIVRAITEQRPHAAGVLEHRLRRVAVAR